MGTLLTFAEIIDRYNLSFTQTKTLRAYLQGRAASVNDDSIPLYRVVDVEHGLRPVLRVRVPWQRRAG